MKNEAQQKVTKENLINFLKQNLKLNLPIEELLEEKIINLDMDSLDLLDLNFNILQTFGVEIKLEKLTPESSLLEIIEQLIAVQCFIMYGLFKVILMMSLRLFVGE